MGIKFFLRISQFTSKQEEEEKEEEEKKEEENIRIYTKGVNLSGRR